MAPTGKPQLQSRFIRPGFLVHAKGVTVIWVSAWRGNGCQPRPATGGITHPINFGWGDRLLPPRDCLDPLRNERSRCSALWKFYDQMKLNLRSVRLAAYWSNCYYALDTDNIASIAPCSVALAATAAASAHFCEPGEFRSHDACRDHVPGKPKLSHQSYNVFDLHAHRRRRCSGLKPYEQHEYTAGIDYQIAPTLAFEARYDRRRLDHVIEDSALVNQASAKPSHRQPRPRCEQHVRQLL